MIKETKIPVPAQLSDAQWRVLETWVDAAMRFSPSMPRPLGFSDMMSDEKKARQAARRALTGDSDAG